MPVKLNHIDGTRIIHMEMLGLVTYEQMKEAYETVLAMPVEYVLLDSQNMIYNAKIIEDEYLTSLVWQYLAKPTTQQTVCILPTDHDLRISMTRRYKEAGYPHKLAFVITLEDALAHVKLHSR